MAGKSYLTLYIISLMITNNILFSILLAGIFLAILIFILYIIWNLSAKWQELIFKSSGLLLLSIISLFFCGVLGIFLYQTNFSFSNLKIIWSIIQINFYYALFSTLLLSILFKYVAKFFIALKFNHINLYNKYIKIFHYCSFVPFIIYSYIGYLAFNFFHLPINLITLISMLSLASLLAYLPLLIENKFNPNIIKFIPSLLIFNLYKGNNRLISMIYLFAQIFLEINIILPFFLLLKNQNFMYNELYSSVIFKFKDFFTMGNVDYSIIYLYGLFILIFYSLFYVFSRKTI